MLRKFHYLILTLFLSNTILPVNDTLVVNNGDALVGEIKTMERSVVKMETDYSDTDFMIDWDKVAEIYSTRMFVVTTDEGHRYYGKIRTDISNKSMVVVREDTTKHLLKISDIVYLTQVDKNFLSRLSASIDIGFSLAKSNNLTQLTINSFIGYLTESWSTNITYNGLSSTQDNVDPTTRNGGAISFRYFLPDDWFAIATYSLLQNDAQKLKLRSIVQGGIGNYLIRTNSIYLSTAIGSAWNNEHYTEPDIPSKNSIEGFAGIQLNMFDIGDLSLLTDLVVYPSFTDKGRIRSDFNFDLKYDLPLDIYFKLGYTLNYDNQPVEGASDVDYLFQTSVGWEL